MKGTIEGMWWFVIVLVVIIMAAILLIMWATGQLPGFVDGIKSIFTWR